MGDPAAMSRLELQELVAELARSTKELRTSQQETDRHAYRNGADTIT